MTLVDSVKCFRVIPDVTLLLEKQINVAAKYAFYQLSLTLKMVLYTDVAYLVTWIHITVTSRPDYYNILYIGLPSKAVQKIQQVQYGLAQPSLAAMEYLQKWNIANEMYKHRTMKQHSQIIHKCKYPKM